MKTRYRYIHFHKTFDGAWTCHNNKTEAPLTEITYYPPWKQWISQSDGDVIFSASCHRDIAHFMDQLKD